MEQVIKANVFSCLGSQLVPQQDRFGHPSLISQLRHINMEKAEKKGYLFNVSTLGSRTEIQQSGEPAFWFIVLESK